MIIEHSRGYAGGLLRLGQKRNALGTLNMHTCLTMLRPPCWEEA